MTTETQTIQKFCERYGITMTAQRVPARPTNDGSAWSQGARHWFCTFEFNLRPSNVYWTYFSQGSAHTSPPTREDVLDCLATDCQSAESTFEDWCAELGYDSDSRKAEAIYNACRKERVELTKFLSQGKAGRVGLERLEELMYQTERL